MNKKQAIKLAGGTLADLAAVFVPPLTRQAVSKWGKNLPPLRVYQLKELRPAWFRRGGR